MVIVSSSSNDPTLLELYTVTFHVCRCSFVVVVVVVVVVTYIFYRLANLKS